MSRELIESILNKDYVSANELFEERLEAIRENKLYETKRMMQAEVFGGKTRAEAEKDMRARGLTPRKASDVLPDPRDIKIPIRKKEDNKKKRVSEETLDEIKLPGDVSGSLGRKITAAGLKLGKKYLGKDFRSTYMKARTSQPKVITKSDDADLRKTFGVEKPEDSKRPGVIQRNINTLMGREPGYKPEPKTPEQKGGRVGKTIRGVLGVNSAINDYIRRNTGPLEE